MVGYNPGSASLHPGVACISHHLAVEARDKPVITSLRLPAVLTVLFKYASLLKKWGARRPVPRTDSPLTHFASPRGEKCRLGLPSLLRGCGGRLGVLVEGDEVPLRGGRLEYALLSINKERPGLSGSPQARCIRVTSSSGRRTSRSGRMLAGTHVAQQKKAAGFFEPCATLHAVPGTAIQLHCDGCRVPRTERGGLPLIGIFRKDPAGP